MEKTNVMRILDKESIKYKIFDYSKSGAISGIEVAKALNENAKQVFKTIVTFSKSKKNYVFMLPVEKELDLKKCAFAVNEKSIEMLPQKELLKTTGYIHGGCSPIGQKKLFETIIDISAKEFENLIYSAGKIGYQIETKVDDLEKLINAKFFDITK